MEAPGAGAVKNTFTTDIIRTSAFCACAEMYYSRHAGGTGNNYAITSGLRLETRAEARG